MSQKSSSILKNFKDVIKQITPSGRKEYERELFSKFRKELVTKDLGQQLLYQTYGYTDTYAFHPQDIYRPRDKLSYRRRDQLYIDCGILRVVIDKVTKEINRKGIKLTQEFVRKCRREHIEPCMNPKHEYLKRQGKSAIIPDCGMCPNPDVPLGQDGCGEEYATQQTICVECGFPTRKPNIMQKRKLRRLLKGYVNNDEQTMIQVLTHVSQDIEKHDNGFIISKYIYTYDDPENDIKPSHKTWVQTYRGNPSRIRPIISKQGSLGSKFFTCIKHRKQYIEVGKGERHEWEVHGVLRCQANINKNSNQPPVACNEPMQRVHYVQIKEEGAEQNIQYCYIKGEVQHIRKYFPAGAMGISLIDSLYYVILQIIGQEKWIAEYYLKMRMFKGYITAPNSIGSGESIQTMFSREFAKWRVDPYYIPILGIPGDSKHSIEHHRIDDSPQELQFTEQRQEARTQIANAYGVSNVWMNDTSTGAGLNNEGIEMAITNRHIEWGQLIIVEQGLKPLCANILDLSDIHELEYFIDYHQHEEQDLMAEKQRKALDIANARAAQEIGAEVYINEANEFVFASPREGEPLVPLSMQGKQDKQSYQDVDGVGEEGLPYERRSQSKPMSGAPNEPRVSGSGITVKQLKKYFKEYNGNGKKDEQIDEDKEEKVALTYIADTDTVEQLDKDNPVMSTTPGVYTPVHSNNRRTDSEEEEETDQPGETRDNAIKSKKKITWNDKYKPDFVDAELYEFQEFKWVDIDDITIPDDFGITLNNNDTITRIIDDPTDLPAIVVTIVDGKYMLLDGFKRLYALNELEAKIVRIAIVVQRHVRKAADFEQKHPRDEQGRFKPKPKDDASEDDGSDDNTNRFATEQYADEPPTAGGGKPPTVAQPMPTGSGSRKMPVDMTPVDGPTILDHAKKFGGFILNEDMSYYPGGGYWVGTPTMTNSYKLSRLDDKKLETQISKFIDGMGKLPDGIKYVVSAWVNDGYLFMTIGEIYEDMEQALSEAKVNGELEIWDFEANKSVRVKSVQKQSEIIYDFFRRRHNYWKNIPDLEYNEYVTMKVS